MPLNKFLGLNTVCAINLVTRYFIEGRCGGPPSLACYHVQARHGMIATKYSIFDVDCILFEAE